MAKVVVIVLGVGVVLHLVLLERDLRYPGTYVDGPLALALGVAWLVIYLVVAGLAVREVVALTRRGALRELRDGGLLVKLVGIAFFVVNGVGSTAVLAEVGGSPGVVIAVLVSLTWLVMLPTSAYGVGMLVVLRRNGAAGVGYVALNCVLHVLFVLDVLSTVAVAVRATQVLRGTFLFDADLAARVRAALPYGTRGVTPAAWFHAAVMLLSVGVPYAAIGAAGSESDAAGPLAIGVVAAWIAAGIAAAALTLVDAVALSRTRELRALAVSGLTIKLAAIPFFVQNYLVLASLLLGTVLIGSLMAVGAVLGLGAVLLTPLLVAGTYMLMLPTSAHGIACLLRMRRDGVITSAFFVTNLVMHLVFVTDVVSAIVVTRHARRVLRIAAHTDLAVETDPQGRCS